MEKNEKILLFFVFFLSFIFFFSKLENTILSHHDDLTHACIGKMIIVHNDWITMHEGNDVSFLKPPFYFWLEAILFKTFGVSDYLAKFPNALFGFLTIILIYSFSIKFFENKKLGFINLMIILTSFYFIKYSKTVMLDLPVAFITFLGTYFFYKYEFENDKKSIYMVAIIIAIGYYIKAIQGMYLLFIIPFYYMITFRFKELFKIDFIFSLLIIFLLISLWFIPQYLKYGEVFLFSQSGIGPIVHRGIEGHSNKFYNPLIKLLGLNFPWSILGFISLILYIKEIQNINNPLKNKIIFLFSYFFVIILILSISKTFYLRYLLPAMIPLTILSGLFISKHINSEKYYFFKVITVLTFLFYLLKELVLPVNMFDNGGTPYYNFFKSVDLIENIDKKQIVIYGEKYYKLNQGLSYYNDIFPKRYIPTYDILRNTKDLNEFYITNWKEFEKIKEKEDIQIIASEKDKWVLFKYKK